jgi:hypothetical protein
MTDNIYMDALGLFAAFVLYAVFSRGLFRVTEPARQSLVEIGGSLLDSPKMSDRFRSSIESKFDDVHSARSAWRLAWLSIRAMFRMISEVKNDTAWPNHVPASLRDDYLLFLKRWILATLGNSLLATLVFVIAMLIAVALRMSFSTFINLFDGKGDGQDDRLDRQNGRAQAAN